MSIRCSSTNRVAPLVTSSAILAATLLADDLETIRARVIEEARSTPTTEVSMIENWLTTQVDGAWSDIDYGSSSSSGWGPANHLKRLLAFGAAYNTEGNAYYYSVLLETAVDGYGRIVATGEPVLLDLETTGDQFFRLKTWLEK